MSGFPTYQELAEEVSKPGEWIPNQYSARENLQAIEFLKRMNEVVQGKFPGVVTIVQEFTAWPTVCRPTYLGGLGFNFKWNMRWKYRSLATPQPTLPSKAATLD